MIKLNENELKGVVYEAVKEYVSEAIDGNEKVLDFINRNGITNSKEFDKVYKKEKYGDYDKDTKVLDYLNAHPDLDTSQKFDRAVFDEGISRAVRSSISNFIKEDSGFEDGLNPEDFEGFGEEEDDDSEDMASVYTMEDWHNDHSLNPQIGQEIDSEVFYELRDAMSPTTYTKHIFQPGEVYTVDKNYTPLYQTFEFVGEPDKYRYIGLKPEFKKNESKKYINKVVKEAVNKVLNEIGDTEEGQKMLGGVAARKAYNGKINDYYDVVDYAKKQRKGDIKLQDRFAKGFHKEKDRLKYGE